MERAGQTRALYIRPREFNLVNTCKGPCSSVVKALGLQSKSSGFDSRGAERGESNDKP